MVLSRQHHRQLGTDTDAIRYATLGAACLTVSGLHLHQLTCKQSGFVVVSTIDRWAQTLTQLDMDVHSNIV